MTRVECADKVSIQFVDEENDLCGFVGMQYVTQRHKHQKELIRQFHHGIYKVFEDWKQTNGSKE